MRGSARPLSETSRVSLVRSWTVRGHAAARSAGRPGATGRPANLAPRPVRCSAPSRRAGSPAGSSTDLVVVSTCCRGKQKRSQGDKEIRRRKQVGCGIFSVPWRRWGDWPVSWVCFSACCGRPSNTSGTWSTTVRKRPSNRFTRCWAPPTTRSVVDNLLPGMVGVWGVECPVAGVYVLFPLLVGAAIWWSWLAPRRRLCWLGLSMIGLGYWLVYSTGPNGATPG